MFESLCPMCRDIPSCCRHHISGRMDALRFHYVDVGGQCLTFMTNAIDLLAFISNIIEENGDGSRWNAEWHTVQISSANISDMYTNVR